MKRRHDDRYEWLLSQRRWHDRRARETFRKDIARWKWHVSQMDWFSSEMMKGVS